MATVIFLHGLNSFGTDDVRIGALKFGPMHAKLERAFERRDIDFVGVLGVGFGPPEEQAERACRFLQETGFLEAENAPENATFHLLGHSIGGLAARALAARPEMRDRVRTIITVGTPHAGAQVADLALNLDAKHPLLCRVLATCGYDTRKKAAIFRNFTPAAVQEFNRAHPETPGIPEYSLLCEATPGELSWPYLIGYNRLHPRASGGALPKSDGFILSESQKRGEVLGPFAVDHFGEIGYFFQPNPLARKKARREFERLVDTVAALIAN